MRSLVAAKTRLSTRALSCEARRISLGAVGWRQQIERAAAAALGVQLLARSDARDARFDAHPGRVHGTRPFLDCVHNSFVPGSFDVEALSLLHKLFFTGGILLIEPNSRIQLWAGAMASLFVFSIFLVCRPMRHDIADYVAISSLLQLLLVYVSAQLFFQDGGGVFGKARRSARARTP